MLWASKIHKRLSKHLPRLNFPSQVWSRATTYIGSYEPCNTVRQRSTISCLRWNWNLHPSKLPPDAVQVARNVFYRTTVSHMCSDEVEKKLSTEEDGAMRINSPTVGHPRCDNNDLMWKWHWRACPLLHTFWQGPWCHRCIAHAKLCHHLLRDHGEAQTTRQWLEQMVKMAATQAAKPFSVKDVGLE